MRTIRAKDFSQWRAAARELLAEQVFPGDVQFLAGDEQQGLFDVAEGRRPTARALSTVRVPKDFLSLAETVACHREEGRFDLLYRVLWRITHDEPNLLQVTTDDDVHRLLMMEKAVRRDSHKMKAFVRFRKVIHEDAEFFIAWHRPDHFIFHRTAPFFARRFSLMTWSIFSPHESAHWDQQELSFGPGCGRSETPQDDDMEDLWKTYYASTFNPARIKLKMMTQEMPVRHWSTLPETHLIPDLLSEAPKRVDEMIARQEGIATSAADFFPAQWSELPASDFPTGDGSLSSDEVLRELASSASNCRACNLCEQATQTVFGEGPANARIVVIGEQPGDQEDLAGRPFVGPAGEVFNDALAAAGVSRDDVYVTNTVKHFKFEPRGKRRIHAKPNVREVSACRPWLEAEMSVIQPDVIVCMGVTAAQAVIGRDFRITQQRGQFVRSDWCDRTIATYHPSAALRAPSPERRAEIQQAIIDDLRAAVSGTSQASHN